MPRRLCFSRKTKRVQFLNISERLNNDSMSSIGQREISTESSAVESAFLPLLSIQPTRA